MFKVKKVKCTECLFSKFKIVRDERKKEVLKECKDKDAYFACHKHEEGDVCCRAFYDNLTCNLIRIATRLNMIEEVD